MVENCINIKAVKTANKSAILKILFFEGQMSRKDLADKTGLTQAAVSQQISELISSGIVSEIYHQTDTKQAGRRKIILDIQRSKYVGIGIVISKYGSRIGAIDLNGKLLHEFPLNFEGINTVENFIDVIAEKIIVLRDSMQNTDVLIVGAGIGLVGTVSGKNGCWIDTYGFLKENNIPVKALLKQRLKIPVAIEDNVRAMANAEVMFSSFFSPDGLLFIKYGPGFGAAMYIANSLYSGYGYKAAEIGHIFVNPFYSDGTTGKPEILENLISQNAVFSEIKKDFSPNKYPVLYKSIGGKTEKITMPLILDAYDNSDTGISERLNQIAALIATGIYNASCLFDPQKIILHGELFNNLKFFGKLNETLQQTGLSGMITRSSFGSNLDLMGAASLAVSQFLYNADTV